MAAVKAISMGIHMIFNGELAEIETEIHSLFGILLNKCFWSIGKIQIP